MNMSANKKKQLQHAWLIVSNHSPLGGSRTRRSKSPWLLTHVVKQHCLGSLEPKKFSVHDSPIQGCESLFDIGNAAKSVNSHPFYIFQDAPIKRPVTACCQPWEVIVSSTVWQKFRSFNQWLGHLKFFPISASQPPSFRIHSTLLELKHLQKPMDSHVSICTLRRKCQAFGLTGVPANANLEIVMEKYHSLWMEIWKTS